MKNICEVCQKEFQAPPSQAAKFCSRKCYDISREGIFECDNCGKTFRYYKSHKKGKHKFCSVSCSVKFQTGKNHYHWKGADYRIIFEEFLGRKLTSKDVIHHINGDHTDNRMENLLLTDRAGHIRIHLPRRGTKKNNLIFMAVNSNRVRRLPATEYLPFRDRLALGAAAVIWLIQDIEPVVQPSQGID
jgi:hypothetical protein